MSLSNSSSTDVSSSGASPLDSSSPAPAAGLKSDSSDGPAVGDVSSRPCEIQDYSLQMLSQVAHFDCWKSK